jgi:hypothetical protein
MKPIRTSVALFFVCSSIGACSSDDSKGSPAMGTGGGTSSASTSGMGGATTSTTGSGGAPATGSTGGATSSTSGTGGATSSGGAGGVSSTGGSSGAGGSTNAGGGSDAGSKDASSDVGTDAGPMYCPPNAVLCDDFEGPAPGTAGSPWAIETMNTSNDPTKTGKVEWTTDKPAHGTHSMRITIPNTAAGDPAGGSPAFISETKTFPQLSVDLWGRMMIYYVPTSALPNTHWVNVATVGTAPNTNQQLRFGGSTGTTLNANELPSDTFATSATAMPTNKWACFEWHVQSGAAANMHFYVDGTEITDMAVVNGNSPNTMDHAWHSVPFAKLQLGWQYWNGSFGGQMWLDDVAIGTARLNCPPKP